VLRRSLCRLAATVPARSLARATEKAITLSLFNAAPSVAVRNIPQARWARFRRLGGPTRRGRRPACRQAGNPPAGGGLFWFR